ncbi:MAG: hypothetical protein KGK30_09855, partial [Elusimicrobia bacterium]|nr:hypothetical protein [Elusimicrobiota bacterium]
FKVVAVVARLARPCGACRQVLLEFSDKTTRLILVHQAPRRRIETTSLLALLPKAFNPREAGLRRARNGGL